MFDTPAASDELPSEPIEQFRIAGALTLRAEIVGCGNDAAAEMVLPDAVDHDSRGELARAVIDVRDPIGERAAMVR